MEDARDLLGIHADRNGVLLCPVHNGGDATTAAQTAGFILAARSIRSGLCFNYFRL
jgi:hypothetical protein